MRAPVLALVLVLVSSPVLASGALGSWPPPLGSSGPASFHAAAAGAQGSRAVPGSHRPAAAAPQAPSTSINGTVHLNGSLESSFTYLNGSVSIVGATTASGLSQTEGWAQYGPTVVTGSMTITNASAGGTPIFATNGDSSVWSDPALPGQDAMTILQGNIAFGDANDGFDLSSNDVNMTIQANEAGGFYGLGSSYNLDSATTFQLVNYANSSTVTLNCNIPLECPISVAPGTTFTPCFAVIGCQSASAESMTWPANSHFSILGSLSTGGAGIYGDLPDSRLVIDVPALPATNMSLTPDTGEPSLTVGTGATYPPLVMALGHTTVSGGEAVNGAVVVRGTFSAFDWARNGGLFTNAGELSVNGSLNSSGVQRFPEELELGPQIAIDAFPGRNITTEGATDLGPVVSLNGTTVATGDLTINGTLDQDPSTIQVSGDVSLQGTLTSVGNVVTQGTTSFEGSLSSQGNITLPNAALQGGFTLSGGSFLGTGSTVLSGTTRAQGMVRVNATTYSVVGSTWLSGNISVNRSIVVSGHSVLSTAVGGALRLTATVEMGGISTVRGTVLLQGTSFANGTTEFNGTTVIFPSGLRTYGVVEVAGNTSVVGGTEFSGSVVTDGVSRFPGMLLEGAFGLSAQGGSVNATGTSTVAGNVTLDGLLTVGDGEFREVGSSTINGDLTMTGTVVVNGASTLTTAPGTRMSLFGDVDLAGAARIIGDVNTSGNVTISGTATLGPAGVDIVGSLSERGSVYSRGEIDLTGQASFDGPLNTVGHTVLPGITTSGNFTLAWGSFDLDGNISLDGFTVATGLVTANSTGYFVVGSSRIVGSTTATGTMDVVGASTTVGYVDVDAGSQFGTYLEVNGPLDAGGLSLSGPVTLPDDTVIFAEGANISGSTWISGTLTGSAQGAVFVGESIINGSVSSPGSPSVAGPIVVEVLGSSFALELDAGFYAYVAGLAAAMVLAGVELFRWGYHRRAARPSTHRPRHAGLVRVLVGVSVLAGSLVGGAGGFSLGSELRTPANAGSGGALGTYFLLGAVLLWLGVVLWAWYRLHLWRTHRHHGSRAHGLTPHEEVPSTAAASSERGTAA